MTKPLTAIPKGFGTGGAGLYPNGGGSSSVAGKKPDLEQILNEHYAAILSLQGGAGLGGPVVEARFASTGNVVIASNNLTAVDGVTPVAGNIALLRFQSTPAENGLYVVVAAGPWTRLKDDAGNDVIDPGMLVTVAEGTVNADRLFELVTNAPITVGSTSLSFQGTDVSPAAGAALTDASPTVTVLQGKWRVLPAATLSTDRTITLGTTGAIAGDKLEFTRLDVSAHQLIFVNGGAGAGTLFTMAVSKLGCATFQYDGTNWALKSFGVQ